LIIRAPRVTIEGTIDSPSTLNINLQPSGKIKGVGKGHIPNPTYHKKHVRKGKGRYIMKNN
jgi:hypothetical protein